MGKNMLFNMAFLILAFCKIKGHGDESYSSEAMSLIDWDNVSKTLLFDGLRVQR